MYGGDRSPARFEDLSTLHAFRRQLFHCGLEVVTHQIKLVGRLCTLINWMDRHLGTWRRQDQPALSCVYQRKVQNVSKKGADFLRVPGIDERVEAVDHGENLPLIHTDDTDKNGPVNRFSGRSVSSV